MTKQAVFQPPRLQNGATLKQQGPARRTGPASLALDDEPGLRASSLALDDEPGLRATSLALDAEPGLRATSVPSAHAFGSKQVQNDLLAGACETAKHHGTEGRKRRLASRLQCLTLLSEPTRKLVVFQPLRLKNGALATPKQQGPEGSAGALATPKEQGPEGRTGESGLRATFLALDAEPGLRATSVQNRSKMTFWQALAKQQNTVALRDGSGA
eukprot:s3272_g5.t1